MDNRLIAGLAVLVLLAACGSSASESTSTAPAPTTVATVPMPTTTASTTAAPTTAAPTTAAPTTVAPTTAEPTTAEATTAISLEHEIAFSLSLLESTPLTFEHGQEGVVVHSAATGDIVGPLTSAFVSAGGPEVALAWFEGTVAECGSGGAAIRISWRSDGELGWELVPGIGTGDLASLTGSGTTSHGFTNALLGASGPPNFTGTVRCEGGGDVTVFSSTLLEPPAASGIGTAVPFHVPLKITDYPVGPHPAQADAPRMWISEIEYATWTSTMVTLGVPFPETSTTPMRNTMVSILVSDPEFVCSTPAVVRVFIDDVLYPEFRGAWDVNPHFNPGMSGGGVYNATTNEGRVDCG